MVIYVEHVDHIIIIIIIIIIIMAVEMIWPIEIIVLYIAFIYLNAPQVCKYWCLILFISDAFTALVFQKVYFCFV